MGGRAKPALSESVKERIFELVRDGLPPAWIADDVGTSEYRVREAVRGTPEGPLLNRNGWDFKSVWAGIVKSSVLLDIHQEIFTKRINKGVSR